MKKRTLTMMTVLCMLLGLFAACGTETVVSESKVESAVASTEVSVSAVEEEEASEVATASEEASVVEEVPGEDPSAAEEAVEENVGGTCVITFSDGQTFEAVVGEDFVFFFQCDAPGDMGEPAEGEEGAGITVSEGTVTYSNVGLGGPYSYPTSEKVTISGFTGDITVTITEAATNMGATYTIYTDEAEIADAIAFAEEMAAQQAANPMP